MPRIFCDTLESKLHGWLTRLVPKDIKNEAGHPSNALCARLLLTEYYFTVHPTPDTIGFALPKFIRHPASQATNPVNVLTNIELRGAFSKLIMPLMLSDSDFKFVHQMIHERTLRSQRTTDDEVLTYFTQIEEIIHAMDPRKALKLPQKPVPVKANAINTGETQQGKSKGGKPRSESAPPAPTPMATKPDDKKGVKKGVGRGKGGQPVPKPSPNPPNSIGDENVI